MASNITAAASSTFTTANMKPAVNEQIDALKAQNDADNMGHLYYREIDIPQVSGSSPSWLFMFTKKISHDGLRLMVRGDNTGSAAAVTDTVRIYADAVDTVAGSPTITQTHSYTRGANTVSAFDIDISSLQDGDTYMVKVTLDTAKTFHAPLLRHIHTTSATY